MPSRIFPTHVSFVLAVPDATQTAKWWVATMGFDLIFETPGWTFVQRGACMLRLGSCPDAMPPADLGDHRYFGYLQLDAIDDFHDEISRKGAHIPSPPRTQAWGMREMLVETPDGHLVMFAEGVSAIGTADTSP